MEMARQFQGHKATIQEQADIIKYLQRQIQIDLE